MDAARGEVETLLDAAGSGDRRALARLLTQVEREALQGGRGAGVAAAGRLAGPGARRSRVCGITGAPGAGKSTLAAALLAVVRSQGASAAVLAVDPSSPRSGGALLGDRVRMAGHSLDAEVFVRSLATRGALGGLSSAVLPSLAVLEAAGFDEVFVETVGVGQSELDVARAADTTIVVVNPGWGDSVQAAKAGLNEIADVFAMNKADRPGAERSKHEMESALGLSAGVDGDWTPRVILTDATTGAGVEELWSEVERHTAWLEGSGELELRRSARAAW